ncbi:DUF6134 family protein [Thiocapsa rosea]|uniref:Uncharacterized protein n=1 Tax=Thiocapsa rosea TaxID=69360 RepID=A0A495V6F8_9GAMM|nr:DUF6134 family protein [Thiocapsa rosea]RKT44982.1 hypothetical protein BDD21_2392 [Thiocapsa rosea]
MKTEQRRLRSRPATEPQVPARRRWWPAAAVALMVGAAPWVSASTESENLRFKVFLDQDPIGEHSFDIRALGEEAQVSSRASFDINFWIFTAYSYRHESRETWRNGCLQRIEASTDDNGKDYRVRGEGSGEALALSVNGESRRLPGCVMTFAYWDRDFLEQDRLLNPQTGELVPVRVQPQGTDSVSFGSEEVAAARYKLSTDELELILWYSDEHGWIGLESDTGRGKTLRYQRVAPT